MHALINAISSRMTEMRILLVRISRFTAT